MENNLRSWSFQTFCQEIDALSTGLHCNCTNILNTCRIFNDYGDYSLDEFFPSTSGSGSGDDSSPIEVSTLILATPSQASIGASIQSESTSSPLLAPASSSTVAQDAWIRNTLAPVSRSDQIIQGPGSTYLESFCEVINGDLYNYRMSRFDIVASKCNCGNMTDVCTMLDKDETTFAEICTSTMQFLGSIFYYCTCEKFPSTCDFLDQIGNTNMSTTIFPSTLAISSSQHYQISYSTGHDSSNADLASPSFSTSRVHQSEPSITIVIPSSIIVDSPLTPSPSQGNIIETKTVATIYFTTATIKQTSPIDQQINSPSQSNTIGATPVSSTMTPSPSQENTSETEMTATILITTVTINQTSSIDQQIIASKQSDTIRVTPVSPLIEPTSSITTTTPPFLSEYCIAFNMDLARQRFPMPRIDPSTCNCQVMNEVCVGLQNSTINFPSLCETTKIKILKIRSPLMCECFNFPNTCLDLLSDQSTKNIVPSTSMIDSQSPKSTFQIPVSSFQTTLDHPTISTIVLQPEHTTLIQNIHASSVTQSLSTTSLPQPLNQLQELLMQFCNVFNTDISRTRINVDIIKESNCNCQHLNSTCQSLQRNANFTMVCSETAKTYSNFPLTCLCTSFNNTCQFLDELNQTAAGLNKSLTAGTSTHAQPTLSTSSIPLSSSHKHQVPIRTVPKSTSSQIAISTPMFILETMESSSSKTQSSVQPSSSQENIQTTQSSPEVIASESSPNAYVPSTSITKGPELFLSIQPRQSIKSYHALMATASIANLEIANLESNVSDNKQTSAGKPLAPGFIMLILPLIFTIIKLINI
ncbi:uncharacterized protein [Clytia hemisphaerica]